MGSREAEPLAVPLAVSSNYRINVAIYSDNAMTTPATINSKTVAVLVRNNGSATWKSYTASAVSASLGTAYITLTGASHAATGVADMQLHVNGLMRRRYTVEFVEKAG